MGTDSLVVKLPDEVGVTLQLFHTNLQSLLIVFAIQAITA